MADATSADKSTDRLAPGLKLAYGSGQAVDAVVQAAVGSFLLFYLTAVCGISGTAAGSVFLASLVIDGLLDPYIGRLSDRWRSRWGRRLPFMVCALPPLCVSLALMFSIPIGLGPAALVAYVLTLNIILRVSLSVFALPHSALTAELTDDYTERSSISAYRAVFIVIGTAAALLPAFMLIFTGHGGLQSRDAYPWLGALTASLVVVFGLSCVIGARKAILRLPQPSSAQEAVGGGFFSELLQLFRNRSFVPLFVGAVLVLVGQGLVNSLNLHVFRYFWKLPESAMQLPLLVLPIGMLVGTAGAGLLMRRIEKRDGVMLAVIVLSVYLGGLTVAGIAGLVTPGSTLATALVVVNGLLFGICGAVCFVCFYSMIADAVDEHDHLFGVRREALYAAALMLGAKAATGLGSFLAGVGLQLVGFPSSSGVPAAVTQSTATGLVLLWGPGSAVLFLSALPLFRRYRIDRAHHAHLVESLSERRAQRSASGQFEPSRRRSVCGPPQ